MSRFLTAALILTLSSACSLQGAVVMFDFGPTEVTEESYTNSPYHTATGNTTDTTWNQVQTADISTGILLGDGGTSSIGINLGTTASGTTPVSTLVDLSNVPAGNNALGTVINSGVYTGASVGKDGIYGSTNTGVTMGLGVQVTGLAAGTYDVYVTTRNTNTSSVYNMTTYWGTGVAGEEYDYAAYSNAMLSYASGASSATSDWVAEGSTGENYVKFTITLDGTEALNLGIAATGGQTRGFINSLQIVSVPEPGKAMLLGTGLALMLMRRRRSRCGQ